MGTEDAPCDAHPLYLTWSQQEVGKHPVSSLHDSKHSTSASAQVFLALGRPSLEEETDPEGSNRAKNVCAKTGELENRAMVCRHWKSKGWCRFDTNCKFMHPESKCGIGSSKKVNAQRADTEIGTRETGGVMANCVNTKCMT